MTNLNLILIIKVYEFLHYVTEFNVRFSVRDQEYLIHQPLSNQIKCDQKEGTSEM